MATRAYQEIYLNRAQSMLGDMFHYAINTCGLKGKDFTMMFVVSPVSKKLENGEPAYLTGKSGIEVAREVVQEAAGETLHIEPQEAFNRSPEYWVGWSVAYYQWFSDRKYSDIFEAVGFDDLLEMYHPLHEADITKFVEIMDARVKQRFQKTNLKRIRTARGISQAELATLAAVGLRSIQLYEQRKKDINKASADALYRIAKVLGCAMEDLIERGV